jgi:hypothetical protein
MILQLFLLVSLLLFPFSGNAWEYDEQIDKMREAKSKYASTESLNKVQFAFPYNGGSNLKIIFRKSPKYGYDAILRISKGQFTCFMECKIHAKFDNAKIESYSATGARDGSADTIFIDNYNKFVSKVKKAKKLVIEADFYDVGSKQFEFNVEGLKWD